jgi:DNA repair ATPase RecN
MSAMLLLIQTLGESVCDHVRKIEETVSFSQKNFKTACDNMDEAYVELEHRMDYLQKKVDDLTADKQPGEDKMTYHCGYEDVDSNLAFPYSRLPKLERRVKELEDELEINRYECKNWERSSNENYNESYRLQQMVTEERELFNKFVIEALKKIEELQREKSGQDNLIAYLYKKVNGNLVLG